MVITKRNLFVVVFLTIITFGIYNIYWNASVQNQLYQKTGKGFEGLVHVLLQLFVSPYLIYWFFVVSPRIGAAGGKNRGPIYGIINLAGMVGGLVLMVMGMDLVNSADASAGFEFNSLYWIGLIVMGVAMVVPMVMIQYDINKIKFVPDPQ